MNTAKQVNVMIGLLFVGLFGTFLYFLFDNGFNAFGIDFEGREAAAVAHQEKVNAERGGFLYARNCRACHGLTGQGAIERGGLPGAPLNDDANRPPELTTTEATARKARLAATIHCGRVGTLMPAWSTEEGGPLNEFQIEQLVKLITSEFSEEAWEHAVEEGNHSDLFDPGKRLAEDIGEDDTTITLNDASGLLKEGVLRIGGDAIDEEYEILLVVEVDENENTVEVERAVDNSSTLAHEAGDIVYNGPIPAPDSPITGEAPAVPPCGQSPAQPAGTPAPPVTITGDVALTMDDNLFQYDGANNPNFEVAPGDAVSFALTNAGANLHNMVITGPDGEYGTDDDIISDPDAIAGGEAGSLEFAADEAGTFLYQCDFHPDAMLGEITVTE
ncbi:MAG: plastocyanin/azurin family copper-binding protein [Dehalococcoidia bacterium]